MFSYKNAAVVPRSGYGFDSSAFPLLNHHKPTPPPIPMKPNALRLYNDPAQRDIQNVPFGCSFHKVYRGLFRGHGWAH
jgi:hypothetical protein